ncbi:DUF4435 domain-containing protein [Komarekiella sp. 'clone 1']|uniref:DUF4435 domain-containing protein n=1 Tax=Komarekiella delphini-convector SJRDD-AB1 TaxID=2593771 RepID=A0AA40SYV0_9NOST|nr:DUF4435 domain-containing protein [Komarekiella delphini-convector]MBD6617512.1 DUF4435 domain-containing protein [Komarekiella delphini-convector SJRDD-AB1]
MFIRTSSGIKNSDLFTYNNEYIIYVEGEDDGPFWKQLFPDYVDGYKPKFKHVGGKKEIKKYLDELLISDAKFIVAIDSDYNFIMGKSYNHINNRVLETQTHSIENLMLCSSNIRRLIQNLSKNTDYDSVKVEIWLQHFNEAIYSLMVADYIIECNPICTKKCMGDQCRRFLKKNNIPEFSQDIINTYIQTLELPEDDLSNNKDKLRDYKPSLHARGHFFFSAVHCFVINEVRKISQKHPTISLEAFYSMSIESCHWCFKENSILEKLRERAIAAAQELVQLLRSS